MMESWFLCEVGNDALGNTIPESLAGSPDFPIKSKFLSIPLLGHSVREPINYWKPLLFKSGEGRKPSGTSLANLHKRFLVRVCFKRTRAGHKDLIASINTYDLN
jgi:hypothetical protein